MSDDRLKQYRLLEEWIKRFEAEPFDIKAKVDTYIGTYPGRAAPLVLELVKVAREWTTIYEQVNGLEEDCYE